MIDKKQKLDAPIWFRASKENRKFVDQERKRLGYSRSVLLDLILQDYRYRKQGMGDRKKK